MKKLIKKRVVSSKNGVKSIQIVGYNGTLTVISNNIFNVNSVHFVADLTLNGFVFSLNQLKVKIRGRK